MSILSGASGGIPSGGTAFSRTVSWSSTIVTGYFSLSVTSRVISPSSTPVWFSPFPISVLVTVVAAGRGPTGAVVPRAPRPGRTSPGISVVVLVLTAWFSLTLLPPSLISVVSFPLSWFSVVSPRSRSLFPFHSRSGCHLVSSPGLRGHSLVLLITHHIFPRDKRALHRRQGRWIGWRGRSTPCHPNISQKYS